MKAISGNVTVGRTYVLLRIQLPALCTPQGQLLPGLDPQQRESRRNTEKDRQIAVVAVPNEPGFGPFGVGWFSLNGNRNRSISQILCPNSCTESFR